MQQSDEENERSQGDPGMSDRAVTRQFMTGDQLNFDEEELSFDQASNNGKCGLPGNTTQTTAGTMNF